ncbi:cell division protein ZapA [Rhodoferax ferrireducens]|uniref:cell division protein ZapA n=1 Tax=Rhodoferax ferrireducens TaxID=192843 RepID=UPI00298EC9D1|nr:cell division protein ZapA [Rhodoferax ferrireducens]WPC65503.1 cell division protein ZapA [Rhodoferax ferrireducens]
MKQLEVQIMGQAYLLGCPDGGESRLLEAVEKVDTAMCRIRDGGKVRARDRIAVLAALNLAFDLADKSSDAVQAPVHAASFDTGDNPAQGVQTPDDRVLLASLLERLDVALGTDGRLL